MENNSNLNSTTVKKAVSEKIKKSENSITRRYIYSGALWILSGFVLIGVALYRGSGMKAHVVIWAAFGFGIIQFVRGIARLKK